MDPASVLAAIGLVQMLIKFIDDNSGGQKATIDELRTKSPEEILANLQVPPVV